MHCLNEEIEMTRRQSCIQNYTRTRYPNWKSESIRWQTIRYTGLDGDVGIYMYYIIHILLCNICIIHFILCSF